MRSTAAVFVNAGTYGITGVAVPLALSARGLSKLDIAAYFTAAALSAAILNLAVGPALRRRSPVWTIRLAAATGTLGLLTLVLPSPYPVPLLAGIALSGLSLVFPLYVARAGAQADETSTGTVSHLRSAFVGGYICGLVLLMALQLGREHGIGVDPLLTAIAMVGLTGVLAGAAGPCAEAPPQARTQPSTRTPMRTLGLVVAAMVLLRAADMLRLVYLPLYLVSAGWSEATSSGILLASVLAELPLLALLSHGATRWGSSRIVILTCIAGATSFSLVAMSTNLLTLLTSQLLYAVLAAGFQSIAIVYLGQFLRGGLGAGAGLHTALFQLGSLVGIAAPLLVPGYHAAMFAIAGSFCTLAGVSTILVAATHRHVADHRQHILQQPPIHARLATPDPPDDGVPDDHPRRSWSDAGWRA
jgi:hypothetical protein